MECKRRMELVEVAHGRTCFSLLQAERRRYGFYLQRSVMLYGTLLGTLRAPGYPGSLGAVLQEVWPVEKDSRHTRSFTKHLLGVLSFR